MNDLAYVNYLFSRQELMVLSACSGMDTLSTFAGTNLEPPDKKEMNKIIFGLYQKGILKWRTRNTWTLSPAVRPLFQSMKLSGKELQICSSDRADLLLCFLGDDVVVMELSRNDQDMVKLHRLPADGLYMELCDRGILPVEGSQEAGNAADEEGEEPWQRFLRDCPELMKEGKIQHQEVRRLLKEREEMMSYITVRDTVSGQDQGILLILEYGIADGIICVGDGFATGAYYTPELLKAFLRQ